MNIGKLKKNVAHLNCYGTLFLDNLLYYGGKIIARFVFPFVVVSNYQQYVTQASYYSECELKSHTKILWEQLLYVFRTGEINKNYFIFGFDRKSKNDFKNNTGGSYYKFPTKKDVREFYKSKKRFF